MAKIFYSIFCGLFYKQTWKEAETRLVCEDSSEICQNAYTLQTDRQSVYFII